MGAGHAHALYVHEHSLVHDLSPHVKIFAAFSFAIAVAITPREAVWAFAIYAVLLSVAVVKAKLPARFVFTRMVAVVPFILFAFLLPFIASGDPIEVLGVTISGEGLWGTWNILAKATLGITTSIVLAGTTDLPDLLRGMNTLKVPPALTAIAGFMVRYLAVIAGELRRMRVAMTARGYDPRWLWQAKPIASSAGAMFIRSYERGERVHQAMLSRGYTGTMPDVHGHHHSPANESTIVGVWLFLAVVVSITAMVLT